MAAPPRSRCAVPSSSPSTTRASSREEERLSSEISKLRRKIYADLPLLEAAATFAVAAAWWGWFVWRWFDLSAESLFWLKPRLQKASSIVVFGHRLDRFPFRVRYRDNTNYMWDLSLIYLNRAIPWLAAHTVAHRLLKLKCPEVVPFFHAVEFFVFCSCQAGVGVAFLLMVPPVASYFAAQYARTSAMAWAVALALIGANASQLMEIFAVDELPVLSRVIFRQILAWGVMRCVSFSTWIVKNRRADDPEAMRGLGEGGDFDKVLGFYCYLPSSYLGPLSTYESYLRGLVAPPIPLTWANVSHCVWALVRCSAVLFVHHAVGHFVYVHALGNDASLLRNLDLSTLVAVGIYQILNFSAMYAPTYGLSQLMARVDGIEPVPNPSCLAHVYLYSECWRLFDVGFYNYVRIYIYTPVARLFGGYPSQLAAMVPVYVFVFLYHGASRSLLNWTCSNFAQVLLESICIRTVSNSQAYTNLKSRMSPVGLRRFHAVISLPSWFFGALTLQYFFAHSVEVGDVYVNKFLSASWLDWASIWAVGYTGVQLAMEANNCLARRRMRELEEQFRSRVEEQEEEEVKKGL